MRIFEFKKQIYQKLQNKKIFLVEKSISYLEELDSTCDIMSNVAGIVDENKRKCGEFFYNGIQIRVYPLEYLKKLDFEETALVITSDYYGEYLFKIEKLIPKKLEEIYVFYNYETKLEMYYRNVYKDTELQNIIIFRSGPHNLEYVRGMDFADNARALFEYMISAGFNKKYELIWFVKNPDEYIKYDTYENVSFLSYDDSVSKEISSRNAYYRALCLARFIFFTDAYGFARNCREDQIRVQLWHGCGYKMRLNRTPCEKRYEYMTVTSELYADIHARVFGLRREQMLITGCAKEDWLFQRDEEKLSALKIPRAHKYIFWLPTYRFSSKDVEKPKDGALSEETGLPLLTCRTDLISLNKNLISHNVMLLIKLHPFQDVHAVHCDKLSNIILMDNDWLTAKDLQLNQLLSQADALLSDYSSAAVDFLLLDRPIGFIVDDLNDYSLNRGFIFDNILEWLPGKCIFERNDLDDFIEEIAYGQDSHKMKRQKLRGILHKNIDGENCRRIVESLEI